MSLAALLGLAGWLALTGACVALGVALLNALAWPRVQPCPVAAGATGGNLSVLIPARNEVATLPACLDSVLAQGPLVGEVLVYDDHSTDGTGLVIDEYSKNDTRVRRIDPEPLPAGWCGKPFACAQLAARAGGEWVLFIDADARLAPGAANGLMNAARERGATLLSAWPRLVMIGGWEKILMPMLNVVTFTLFPAPLALSRGEPALGLAHGACLLALRSAYERTGGHSVVRAELFEDTALARAWRTAGERSLCLDGSRVVQVRMYDSLTGIRAGFLKNFYPAFRREASFWLFLLWHGWVMTAPFLLWPLGGGWLAAAVVVLGVRLTLCARFSHPLRSALLHPLAEGILIAVGLSSRRRARGGGVEWKGRVYGAGR